ncbi:HD-GYP domain-containing protein [Congregibacter sp.]|uniref:HD-GYP domain-containing protein n=1 Tax=Congregibacter sp. TaxID=2744308 RepID=UPI003F6BAB03
MLKIVKCGIGDLEVGMFVSELDRPWLGTPFLLQGFRIEDDSQIEQLREYCRYVFVDQLKSGVALPKKKKIAPVKRKPGLRETALAGRNLRPYYDKSTWKEEIPKAAAAFASLSETMSSIFKSGSTEASLDIPLITRSVRPMIQSISRNPDACIWLAQLKQRDDYTYQHSLATSVWAVALGRQLGLPADDLNSLAVGGLLVDIGKLQVDPELLHAHRRLEGRELEIVRDHVRLGAEMIENSDVNEDVRAMVIHHHERHDGSGYPNGLYGDGIPVFARIAAIVDAFDAMTSHRNHAKAISPAAAIKILHDGRDKLFQAELVEEFIQAIGIYPAGTLVELSSGEVAVVAAECRARRLRPRVLLLLDADKKRLDQIRGLDLMSVTEDSRGQPLDIVNSLEPGAYGISMSGLRL